METINKPFIGRKIIATIIDYSLLYTITFYYLMEFGVPNDEGGYSAEGIKAIPPILFWFLLLPGTECFFTATLGHWLVGLKVIEEGGLKADFLQTIKRRLADIIDIFFFGIPAMISINKTVNNQRLGDLWAETIVVRVNRRNKDKNTCG